MVTPELRDRSDPPHTAKKIEYVAPEEIQAAIERAIIERAINDSYGLAPHEVAISACRLLGFSRVTDQMRRRSKNSETLTDIRRGPKERIPLPPPLAADVTLAQ